MKALVVWGSTRGGTQGIAEIVAQQLRESGVDAVATDAASARALDGYDAVVVGGALYANRWHPAARRFIARNIAVLRTKPVWFFSSGPLDVSADGDLISPTREVSVLMERVGALGHATFGGRIEPNAKGFPASAMAKKHSGDWRNPGRVRAWAASVASAMPAARPGAHREPPGRSLWRLAACAGGGWAVLAVLALAVAAIMPGTGGNVLHAVLALAVFALASVWYFGARGAREPLIAAAVFAIAVAALDAIVIAGIYRGSFAMFASVGETWLPYLCVFLATWITGSIMAMIPTERASGTAPLKGRTAS
ncbi:MAG TPA: flavodoxin domain-containing protein [Bauldia sp.]|nr:flavodoxin domain-containing protein [Bauldia sp.]